MEISKIPELTIKMENGSENPYVNHSYENSYNTKTCDSKQTNNDKDKIEEKTINFSDYTNYLLNYPIQNIFWNGNRNKINKDQLSRIKEVLKFLRFLKYDQDYSVNPLERIDAKYIDNGHSPELFIQEFKEFHHLFDKKAFDGLSEKRDRLDAIRKILQNYLNYYADHRFDFMVRYLDRISTVENDVIEALSKIDQIKYKITNIKARNLINSMKLILAKSKINNLQKIKNVYKFIFEEIKIFHTKLKLKKNNNDYGYKHYILSSINKKITELYKNLISINPPDSSSKITHVNLIKNFLYNNEKKIKKINFKYAKCLKDLFRLKNKNYIYLHLYFVLINSDSNSKESNKEYLNILKTSFKRSLKAVITGSFSPFINYDENPNENKIRSIKILDEDFDRKIKKSDLVNFIDSDRKLLDFFKYLISNVCILIDNLKYYIKIHERLNSYLMCENSENNKSDLSNSVDPKVMEYFRGVFTYDEQVKTFAMKMEKQDGIDEQFKIFFKKDIDKTFKHYNILLHEILRRTLINSDSNIFDLLNKNKVDLIKQIELKITKIMRFFEEKMKRMSLEKFLILVSYFYILIDYITVKIIKNDDYAKTNLIKINIDCIIIEFNELMLKKAISRLRNELSNESFKRVTLDYSKYSACMIESINNKFTRGLNRIFKKEFNSEKKSVEYKRFKINDLLEIIHELNLKGNSSSNELNSESTDVFNSDDDLFSGKNLYFLEDKEEDMIQSYPEIISKNNKNCFFFTSSNISVMSSIISILKINFVFEKLQEFLQKEEKILIDYYILACISIPTKLGYYLTMLLDHIDLESIKNSNNWDLGFERIIFQKDFSLIKTFLNNLERKLRVIYNKETNLKDCLKDYENSLKNIKGKRNSSSSINKKNINDNSEGEDINKFVIPKLEREINLLDENIYSSCNSILISFKSIDTLITIYKETKYFEIYYQEKNSDEKEIEFYENVKSQIKRYLFYPLCMKLMAGFFDNLSVKIINMNWELDESQILYNICEVNFYIDNILDQIKEIFENIVISSEIENLIKYFHDFLEIICVFLNDKLIESYSKVKKCSSLGRSIMLKDVKTLIDKIEEIFVFKYYYQIIFRCGVFFKEVLLFINAWHFDEDNLISYLKENLMKYNCFTGLINSMDFYKKMSKNDKKNVYYDKMTSIQKSMD